MVKIIKIYYDAKNIVSILAFILLIIYINVNVKSSFPDNLSNSDLNSLDSKQLFITNQRFTDMNLQNLKNNFFYIKNNNLFVPISFFTEEKFSLNNAIYEKDKNIIILTLNPSKLNNNLVVQIPRNILDSKTPDNKDSRFTVLIDDKPAKFLEIVHNRTVNSFLNNASNRELSIKFGKDTKVIEIQGSDLSNTKTETKVIDDSKEKFQKIFPLISENNIKYLSYTIEGGNLEDINLKQNSQKNKTLELFVNPFDINGNLVVQIPRNILDSKTPDNKDSRFTVLIDDKPAKFLEIVHNRTVNSFLNNASSRELSIKFGKDTKVIEIQGSDLSNNQNHIQHQSNGLSITISLFTLGFAALSIIIILLYKKGKFLFIETLKANRGKKNKNREQ